MALYYGYEDNRENFARVLRYEFSYHSFGDYSFKSPMDLKVGVPATKIYGCNLTNNSRIILLSHTFDDDEVLGKELKVLYEITLHKRDGSSESFDAVELAMEDKRLGSTSLYVLNEEILISNLYKGNLWDIRLMELRIKRTSPTAYGNESIVDLLVEY